MLGTLCTMTRYDGAPRGCILRWRIKQVCCCYNPVRFSSIFGHRTTQEGNHLAEIFLLPIRVSSKPYIRSFQHKVLKSILFLK